MPECAYAHSCGTCRFRQPETKARPQYEGSGYCHRFPPVLLAMTGPGDRDLYVEAHRPWVQADNWCGEWQPDLNTKMGMSDGR